MMSRSKFNVWLRDTYPDLFARFMVPSLIEIGPIFSIRKFNQATGQEYDVLINPINEEFVYKSLYHYIKDNEDMHTWWML